MKILRYSTLKVLALIKVLPGMSMDTLIELRFLGLRNNYIKELPHALIHAKKLEVLDLAQNFMVKVPSSPLHV